MTEIKLKYMLSIFADTNDIVPNAATFSKLQSALGDDYIPMTIQEMGVDGIKNRISMDKQDLGIKILFLNNMIIIEKYPKNILDASIGTFEDFCDFGSEIINSLLNEFKKKANRLTFVSKYLLKKSSGDDLNTITSKLFNYPPSYEESNAFEWNWRMVSRVNKEFNGSNEDMNYVTAINRIKGNMFNNGFSEEFEGLDVEFDINTLAENDTLRFDKEEIQKFYLAAKTWHLSHYTNIMNYINN